MLHMPTTRPDNANQGVRGEQMSEARAGYFRGGMPYNRFGHGPRLLVIFQGLVFENKPQSGLASGMYNFLREDYTAYSVLRKPGLPPGYTLQDMADDYTTMILDEFGGPVDVIGISTGGSIVQHFAADHPDLVRRLVIHSSAHTLSDAARDAQMQVACLARQGRWREAWAVLLGFMRPRKWYAGVFVWLGSLLMSFSAPKDASDLVVTVEAEDKHAFRDRLAEIKAPTRVVAGDRDPFHTEELFRETAGIPSARLILYEGMGHPASGKQFRRDLLTFLRET
jgi:pimeloyl-ACP methyl ester carboxylesterase